MYHSIKKLKEDSGPFTARAWYNKWVEKNVSGKILDIGKSTFWDYGFETIDINRDLLPSIVGDICGPNRLISDTYDTVLCNGMYEFVEDPQKMVDEVKRILKIKGIAIFGFVTAGYTPYKRDWKYYDNNIDFKMEIIKLKRFSNYYFIVCKKI